MATTAKSLITTYQLPNDEVNELLAEADVDFILINFATSPSGSVKPLPPAIVHRVR